MSAVNFPFKNTPQSKCACEVLGICLFTSDLGIGGCPTAGSGLTSGGNAIPAPGTPQSILQQAENTLNMTGTGVGTAISADVTSATNLFNLLSGIGTPSVDWQSIAMQGGLIVVGVILVIIGLVKLFSQRQEIIVK